MSSFKHFVLIQLIWYPNFGLTFENCAPNEVPNPDKLTQLTKIAGNLTSMGIINPELYITRWLRFANGNLKTAATLLQKDLQWRKKYNISTILNENWSEFEDLFPHTVNTFDKCGRPVLVIEFGNWDIRNAVLTGRSEKLIRYWVYCFEKEFALLSKLNMHNKNISLTTRIYDYENYNFLQHGCNQCRLIQFNFNELTEDHYSNLIEDVFFVNTPTLVQTAFQLTAAAGLYAPDLMRRTQNLGYDNRYYTNVLLKYIDKNQLSEKYGGLFPSKGGNYLAENNLEGKILTS